MSADCTHPSRPKAAVIDVGTNSVKLVVGELDNAGRLHTQAWEPIVSRLGEGVHATGELSSDAQARTIFAVREFLDSTRALNVERVRLVATSAARDARNSGEFIGRVKSELGVDLEILSEEDECRFSYTAVALDPALAGAGGERAVVDVGGGSTEFIFGSEGRITHSKSVRLGAVRLTEQALKGDPPDANELLNARMIADSVIRDATGGRIAASVVGVGGSAFYLARVSKCLPVERVEEVHASVLTSSDLRDLIDLLSRLTVEQREPLPGLDAGRADIILAGAIIFERVLSALGADELLVSINGFRYGILYELLGITK